MLLIGFATSRLNVKMFSLDVSGFQTVLVSHVDLTFVFFHSAKSFHFYLFTFEVSESSNLFQTKWQDESHMIGLPGQWGQLETFGVCPLPRMELLPSVCSSIVLQLYLRDAHVVEEGFILCGLSVDINVCVFSVPALVAWR